MLSLAVYEGIQTMKRSNDKKMAVYEVLQERGTPLGTLELLRYLPKSFAERSVRRWLDELCKEQLIEKTGQKRSTKYRIPSFSLKESPDEVLCFTQESKQAIAKIRRPVFERIPVSYDESWLKKYEPNRSFYLPLTIRAELLRNGKRSKDHDPAGSYAHRIFNRLLIDLSYNSSRLEGNTYSLIETQKLLLDGTVPPNKSEDEKMMILNHKEAIRFLVDTAPKLQVSKETIYTIHYLLSDGLIEPHYVGKVRDHDVRIGGSSYIPYTNPTKLEKQLELITKKAALIKDPYEQSFFLLIHLSYLQAFSDVNKRTARLAANISLIKNNLVPLSFIDVIREDYTSSILAVYELQDVRPMIDLYLFSYKRTCAMYDSTIQSMGVDILRVRYRKQRRQLLTEIILQKKVGASIDRFIKKEASKLVPKNDLPFFIEDVKEDLVEIDSSRIYGLGVTMEEFRAWGKLHKQHF